MKPILETAGLRIELEYTKELYTFFSHTGNNYVHTVSARWNDDVYKGQRIYSEADKITDERIKQDLTFGVLRMIAEKIEWKTS